MARRGTMPRRSDLSSVLVIGSGPIVIGQACEFDYSGTQACRVLRAEGLRVSLVNSNPATVLAESGVLEEFGVELIGASLDAIRAGEDRQLFKDLVRAAGCDVPESTLVRT